MMQNLQLPLQLLLQQLMFALLFVILISTNQSATGLMIGAELPPTPTYLVLVPRKLRPDQELQVSVSVFRLLYDSLTFRASVRRTRGLSTLENEVAFAEETFHRIGARTIKIRIPENAGFGNYTLHIEGSVKSRGGILFSNRTELIYEPRMFSVFVQFSRPVYAMGDLVKFRVVPYEPNMMVKHRVFSTVEVVDPSGITVRRWLSPRSGARGFLELTYQLPATSNYGEWKVRCTRETFVAEKSFLVDFNTQSSMVSVNVSLPQRLSEFAYGVYGLLEANHTTNAPSVGSASVKLQLWPRSRDSGQPLGVLWKYIPFFNGKSEFLFTMDEIQTELKLSDKPKDLTVRVDAYVNDWFYLVNETSYAYSTIFSETPTIKFLGGRTRQFKPGFTYNVMLLVYQPDGQTPDFRNRYVKLEVFCDISKLEKVIDNIPIPSDSVVRVPIETSRDCTNYRLLGLLQSNTDQRALVDEQRIFKHYSPTESYMQITSATENPTVDSYMVFNVQTTVYTSQIHFLIVAGGNIVYSDILLMPAGVQSKTFSIAASRDMAPISRVVAYFMKQDGELVTDALSFYVDLQTVNSVRVQMTEGSDLTGQTVTGWLTGADAGSFALLSALPYDLYLRYGSKVVMNTDTLLEDLRAYESHSEQPLRYRWFNDSSDVPFSKYFPTPTAGPDANKTMNYSGLIMFTDSNYTKVTFWNTCNETINPERAFPCYTNQHEQCYGWRQVCDGIYDCNSGIDEMNCESEADSTLPGYVPSRFKFEFRHFDYDDDWLWQSIYVKPFPDGRMPINAAVVPKLETAWTVGAIVVDQKNGLRLQQTPAVFTTRRQFYMRLEAPDSVIWGEQIGVRVALFNRWHYWTEVIVEMKRSPQVEFVKVGAFGMVNSYAPETSANQSAHTVVYLRAGSQRTVYFPVLPRQVGDNVVTFCAYAFNGGECSTITISVSMNGIANSYHTPIMLDLVSQSVLQAQQFHIMPEQTFVEPEQRWRRFVPGSKTATFTVAGDIVGPAFSDEQPVGDSDSTVWKPHGSGESVLFNMNWNVQMLHYLRMTQQLDRTVQQRALNYVVSQYSRLSFYMNPTTGGIANFPERFINETSTFLTAFGLWTLGEASFSQWERTVKIGAAIFQNLLRYLRNTQTPAGDENLEGSFEDLMAWDMKYFYDYVKGGMLPEANRTIMERVPTTAMVAIAVSHPNLPKQLGPTADTIKSGCMQFLRKHLNKMAAYPLGLAMTAYALSFDDGPERFQAASMLQSIVRTGNYLYWSNRKVRPLIREPDSAGRYLIKPRVEWPNDALAVQATAIGLMSLYKIRGKDYPGMTDNITKFVNFIVETKNTPNGWISTQDTIFAIRALREIAQFDFNREIYQLKVEVSLSSDRTKTNTFLLTGNNLSVPKSMTIENDAVWGELNVRVTGSGRAMLQLNAQKSVENAFQIKNAADPVNPSGSLQTFEMTCVPSFSGRNASIVRMTSCARWVWTERSETSGIAVMSYTVPSGYKLTNYYLRNVVQNSQVRGLRHIWMSGNIINIFFSNITSTETTCMTLDFPRWFPVANTTIEQACSVYEYYEYDNGNFTLYSARTLFSNDICRVCGSYQCPYCPDFNSATVPAAVGAVGSWIIAYWFVMMTAMVLCDDSC